jgi:hypothetical protein
MKKGSRATTTPQEGGAVAFIRQKHTGCDTVYEVVESHHVGSRVDRHRADG